MNGLSFVYYLKMTTRKIKKQKKKNIKVVKMFLKDNFCKITYGILTI